MAPTNARSRRVLFYSHDTLGLGHLRRTLLLAEGLSQRVDNLDTLIVTGSPMAHEFRVPPNVDYVKLPSVIKLGDERYGSRTLGTSFDQILEVRSRLLLGVVETYRPDLLFVDNVPLGMKGEAAQALEHLRRHQPACRIYLTLRDVIDEPDRVIRLWRRLGVFEALDRYYSGIFVYGKQQVFDLAEEYKFPLALRSKTHYFGYLPRSVGSDQPAETRRRLGVGPDERLLVATVGGGSDGARLIETFLRALPLLASHKLRSVVLLGPDMDSDNRAALRARCPSRGVQMLDFSPEPLPLFSAADLIVSMGGYNTVSEILALDKRAVVVPRTTPRREQLIRCERLQGLGLLHMIRPELLSPALLAEAVTRALASPTPRPSGRIDFSGLDRLVSAMLQPSTLAPVSRDSTLGACR